MSDDPNNPELLGLGVEVDPSGFTTVEQLREYLEQLYQTAIDLAMQGSEKASEFANSLREIITASNDENASLDGLKTQVNDLANSFTRVEQAAQGASEAIKEVSSAKGYDINAQALGYGVSGGMIGPAEDTGEGSGIGSAFAIGHGLSVAGHATGSPALREAGGLVYIEESLRRVAPLAQQLNNALVESGGLIPAFTSGLVALNVPMAGLVATAAPLAAGLVLVGLAVASIQSKLNEGKEIVSAALTGLDTYYKAIQEGTTESIDKQIEKLHQSISARQEEADRIQQQLVMGAQAAANQGVLALAEYSASSATAELRNKHAELQKQIDADKASTDQLTSALNSTQVAINDLMKAADQHRKDYNAEAELAGMSTSALDNRVKAMQRDVAGIDAEIDYLQASGDQSEQTQTKLKQLNDERNKEGGLIEYALSVLRPLAAAREQEIGQYKALRQAADDRRTEIEREGKDYLDRINAERDAKKKKDDEAVKDTLKYNDDIKKANDDEAQAKLDIQQRYANKVKDLIQSAQNASQDAEEKLLQKSYDLRQSAAREDEKLVKDAQQKALDLEIKEHRAEQEDLQSHLQKLNDIQRQFDDQGTQALLDRNFLQLVKLKETKTAQQRTEDDHYAQQEAKRRQSLANEENDLARHLAYERAQRQTQLAYQLADAHIAAQRELEQIGQNTQRKLELEQQQEQRDLDMAVQKANAKLNLLGQEYRNELSMVYQTETEKMRIYAQALAQVRSLGYGSPALSPTPSATSPSTSLDTSGRVIRRFAEGGPFEAYRSFMMSEKAPEALNIGGSAYNIGGKAIVYPLESGSVEKNSGSKGMVNNWYISGPNADEIANKVHDVLERIMQ